MQSFHNLKAEVRRFRKMDQNLIEYNRLLKNIDDIEESMKLHHKELDTMTQTIQALSEKKLTSKQRAILRFISQISGDLLYTNIIDYLSHEMKLPKSTVRWNMKGLRDNGLIQAGDQENKGVPVRLTEVGRIMIDIIFYNL